MQGVKQPAQSPVDATVLAQKAASLDQQRSRFKRALGSDEEPAAEVRLTHFMYITDYHAGDDLSQSLALHFCCIALLNKLLSEVYLVDTDLLYMHLAPSGLCFDCGWLSLAAAS